MLEFKQCHFRISDGGAIRWGLIVLFCCFYFALYKALCGYILVLLKKVDWEGLFNFFKLYFGAFVVARLLVKPCSAEPMSSATPNPLFLYSGLDGSYLGVLYRVQSHCWLTGHWCIKFSSNSFKMLKKEKSFNATLTMPVLVASQVEMKLHYFCFISSENSWVESLCPMPPIASAQPVAWVFYPCPSLMLSFGGAALAT